MFNGGWDWTGVWDDLNEIITVDWVSVGVVVADITAVGQAAEVFVGRAGDCDCKVGKCLASVEAENAKKVHKMKKKQEKINEKNNKK